MITTSIVNVTSYTGLELLRLLSQHPEFSVVSVTARSSAGKTLVEVFPQLQGSSFAALPITEEPQQSELAFVCLPHAAAATSAIQLLQRGTKVVDLSADFRLRDAAQYATWYRHTHPAPALLETAIYGLCERYRSRMRLPSVTSFRFGRDEEVTHSRSTATAHTFAAFSNRSQTAISLRDQSVSPRSKSRQRTVRPAKAGISFSGKAPPI